MERRQQQGDLHYMTGRYALGNEPPCMYCVHLLKIGSIGSRPTGWKCKAFPGEIPDIILNRKISHAHSLPNDHGYTYESKVYEDEQGKYQITWHRAFIEVRD